jgi:hypothetical protein
MELLQLLRASRRTWLSAVCCMRASLPSRTVRVHEADFGPVPGLGDRLVVPENEHVIAVAKEVLRTGAEGLKARHHRAEEVPADALPAVVDPAVGKPGVMFQTRSGAMISAVISGTMPEL